MSGVIVACSQHGLRESHALSHSGRNTTVYVFDSSAPCPVCGRQSPIVNGAYEQDAHGRLQAVLMPSPAQAARMRNVLVWGMEQLHSGDADEERVRERVAQILEKEAPAWRRAIETLLSERAVSVYQLLGFLMLLLTFFGLDPASQADTPPVQAPTSITEDQMRDLLDEYLEQQQESNEPRRPDPAPEERPQEPPAPIQA